MSHAAEMLQQNSSLVKYECPVQDDVSLAPLIASLSNNHTLRKFHVHKTWWTEDDVDVWLRVLEGSPNCTVMDCYWILAHPDDKEETKQKANRARFLLRLHKAFQRGRLLSPGANATNETWIDVILASKDEVSVVYYYLSLKPDLILPSL